MGRNVGGADAARTLIRRTEEDAELYAQLLAICGRELGCVAQPDLDGMEEVLAEKEGLVRRLDARAAEAAPLWERVREGGGEDAQMAALQERVDRLRAQIGDIQRVEDEIAAKIGARRKELRGGFTSLGRVGKAMEAYRPSRVYSPRFLDRKE